MQCLERNKNAHIQTRHYTHAHGDFVREQSCMYRVELPPLMPIAELCANLTDEITALLLVSKSSSFGPSIVIRVFHRCLVRAWAFAGIGRFLAGLFTFMPNVNQLRKSELVQNYQHYYKENKSYKLSVIVMDKNNVHNEQNLCMHSS